MPLSSEDVKTWGKSQVEKEMRERLDNLKSIRDRNDGSFANAKEGDADEIRNGNADLNVLGERLDALKELDAADQHAKALQERLDAPAKGMRHAGPGDAPNAKQVDRRDVGAIFATSDALKEYHGRGIKDIESEVPLGAINPRLRGLDLKGYMPAGMKDVLGENTANAGVETQYPPESIRVGILVDELFQQPNIADLMPQATINQPAVPYMRETVNDMAAAETAEAATAPEASISYEEDSAPVRKIAVMIPVTEEILADEAMVRGYLNNRLPQFINMREDSQLLNGDGTGQNLQGILSLDGVDSSITYNGGDAATVGVDALEAVFKGMVKVQEQFLTPDAAVLSLNVWQQVRLAKDSMGQYLVGPVTDSAALRLWGLRLVSNQNMPAEGAGSTPIVVGAFGQASQIWRRQSVTLSVSDSHADNFPKGILVIKATSRLAVTHLRPAGYAVIGDSQS